MSNDASKYGVETNKKDFNFVKPAEKSNLHLVDKLTRELTLANDKIEKLEKMMQGFEERIKKPYPNVKYLSYRTKKRILVCTSYYLWNLKF